MKETSPDIALWKSGKVDYEPDQISQMIRSMLLENNYLFFDSSFEPSDGTPIDKEDLTPKKLSDYLNEKYKVGERPYYHEETIEKIVGEGRAQHLLDLCKSEKFKMLTHFSILSRAKNGWFNLLISGSLEAPKPSLSNSLSAFTKKNSKKLNDAIIKCYYSRIFDGMTKQDKERYQILGPGDSFPSTFDNLINMLDKAIQEFCGFEYQRFYCYNENFLLNMATHEAINATRRLIHKVFNQDVTEGYSTDTLRAALIKFASINRAINNIDAIINIQNEVLNTLPEDIGHLRYVKTESEILTTISSIFNEDPKNFPNDLIECSILVIKIHSFNVMPYEMTNEDLKEFNSLHMQPLNIALSAVLIYHDFLHNQKVKLTISGETNNHINVYKMLSDFSKKNPIIDMVEAKTLFNHGFPEELFKFLTTRYSSSLYGISSNFYPYQKGVQDHLEFKRKKFELQREAYELLKDLSIKKAYEVIPEFYRSIDSHINTTLLQPG